MSNLSVIPLKKAMAEAGFLISEGEGFLKHEFQMARDYLTNIGMGHIGDNFHEFEAELAKGAHALVSGVTHLVAKVEEKAKDRFDPETGKKIVEPPLNNSPLLNTDPIPGSTANTISVADLHAAHQAPPVAVAEQPGFSFEGQPVDTEEDEATEEAEQAAAAEKAAAEAAAVQAAEAQEAQAAIERQAAAEAQAKAEAEAAAAAEAKAKADAEAEKGAAVAAQQAADSQVQASTDPTHVESTANQTETKE